MVEDKHTGTDWTFFILVHLVLTIGIIVGAFFVYGKVLAFWSASSALIAGLSVTYLYAKNTRGTTPMKILVYLFAALCAAYMVHNGARSIGVQAFNDAQIKKYEIGMAQAAQSQSKKIAREIGLSAKDASTLEKMFDDEVALIASLLAFLEIFTALTVMAVASRVKRPVAQPSPLADFSNVDTAEQFNGINRPKDH